MRHRHGLGFHHRGGEQMAHPRDQVLRLERLADQFIGMDREGAFGHPLVDHARHQDHRGLPKARMLLDVLADLVAVASRHDDVGDDDVRGAVVHQVHGAAGVMAGDDVKVFAAEGDFNHLAHGCAIVDEIDHRLCAHLIASIVGGAFFVDFAQRFQHQLGHGTEHGAGGGQGAGHKFVDSARHSVAGLDDADHGFVADDFAHLGVQHVAAIEEYGSVNGFRVDVEHARLPRVRKHLDDAGQVEVREAALEHGLLRLQHLRGMEAFQAAEQEGAHLGGNVLRTAAAVDVIVAPGAECLHQRLFAAFAHGKDGNVGGGGIAVQDARKIEDVQLAQVGGAQDGGGRVPLQHGERVGGLGAVHHVKALRLERLGQAPRKKNIAVNHQNPLIESSVCAHRFASLANAVAVECSVPQPGPDASRGIVLPPVRNRPVTKVHIFRCLRRARPAPVRSHR